MPEKPFSTMIFIPELLILFAILKGSAFENWFNEMFNQHLFSVVFSLEILFVSY